MSTGLKLTLSVLASFLTGFTTAYMTAYAMNPAQAMVWTPCIISGLAGVSTYLGAVLSLKPHQVRLARPATAAHPGVK